MKLDITLHDAWKEAERLICEAKHLRAEVKRLKEEAGKALEALRGGYVADNTFRLGVLGAQDVRYAISVLADLLKEEE